MINLNLIFNKLYYKKLSEIDFNALSGANTKKDKQDAVKEFADSVKDFNDEIMKAKFVHDKDYKALPAATHTVKMKTGYPGLLVGSGNMHGSQKCDDDINMGFSFDYVTGQPYIPGSSVKGVLRSHFKERTEAVKEFIQKDINIKELEKEIFDGGDVFFDAVIFKGDKNGFLMGEDYITHHGDLLKNPAPIRFFKVLPDVTIEFRFCLADGLITAEEKKKLFNDLLLTFGAGAKTNVGYGVFEEVENI